MAVTLIVPEEVWINDVCTLQLQQSASSTSDADNQVTLTFSMYEKNNNGGDSPDYSEYNLEATYDGWIDGAITVPFRDFARAAWDNGFEYIQVQQKSGSTSSNSNAKTILLHDGIRTCETIVPLHEYRVAKEGNTAPIFFVGDNLNISGVGLENSCFPESGNTENDNTISATSPLETSGSNSGSNADYYRYACVEAREGAYIFSGGGADRTVRVKALETCYSFSARWTGQLGFVKAWAFELSSEKLSPSDNVDFYDPDTIGYPHRAGYEMEVGGIARNLTKEQRRYLADIATANDLTVEWVKESQPARVGTAPSISLTAQLGDVSITFKLIKVMF
ncbi:MAG: hypothetical protein LUE20_00145 [Oscillospiraceae bacterium]|nr:hypothetical protein [Oscillospiraceae bacterium]